MMLVYIVQAVASTVEQRGWRTCTGYTPERSVIDCIRSSSIV